MGKFDAISTLIPHQPPMLLVEEILSLKPGDWRVRAVVHEKHLFLRQDGTLAPETYCELIAQSFAACESARLKEAGLSTDGGGYLVNVREFTAFSYARAKDELVVRVKQEDDFFGTRIVAGSVWRGTEKLAEGVIYIFMWEGKTPPELK